MNGLEDERDPCHAARAEGRPCFPVVTERQGPTASVRESLGVLPPPEQASPSRPPTLEELAEYRGAAPAPVGPSVTFDPGCAGKEALKRLRGRNDEYYLYHLRDRQGERIALYDHKVDATRFQGEIALLGRFETECEALAEHRRADRKLRERLAPADRRE